MTAVTRAIQFHDYGGPEVMKLEEIPRPVPKDDEILVRVHAAGVNPVDWKVREGLVRKRMHIPLPGIPGGDLAGVIEQAGTQAGGLSVGQRVYAMIGLLGAYAEHVAIKSVMAAPMPASLDFVHAASVPLASLTAYQALFEHGGLKARQRVLVHAAAGGVGGFAVQLARNAGAEVVGTASPANAGYVRELGAVDVIDYRNPSYSQYAGRFDLILDLIGGETSLQSLVVLKPGGTFVGVAPPGEALQQRASAAQLRVLGMLVHPDGTQLREIAALIDAGSVRTTLAAVYPVQEAGQAHLQSKSGHTRGKIVLSWSG
jgi:NADPH:quinone reductase-like Zn-dependent oxidoreductase